LLRFGPVVENKISDFIEDSRWFHLLISGKNQVIATFGAAPAPVFIQFLSCRK
jgi:hypothetical protein